MELRSVATDDGDAIRDVAQRSFRASYSLSPRDIEEVIEAQLSDDALAGRIEDGESVVLVAEDEGKVVGFIDGAVAGEVGELRWLHVAPEDRGRGAGTELVERAQSELSDRGASSFEFRVLAANSEGTAFAEHFDLERADRTEIDFGGEEYIEHVYSSEAEAEDVDRAPNEPSIDVPETVTVDGDELTVTDEEVPGDEAPFFVLTRGNDDRYGFLCSNCGNTDPTVDELDRVKCDECGNLHRPDEWDGGYL